MRIREIKAALVDLKPAIKTEPRVPKLETDGFHAPISRYFPVRRRAASGWKRVACTVKAEDGTWGCADYENRPQICREFPDERFKGCLPESCGFRFE